MNEQDPTAAPVSSPSRQRRRPWTLLLWLLLAGVGYYAWSMHERAAALDDELASLTAERDAAVAEVAQRQALVDQAEQQRAVVASQRAALEQELATTREELQRLQAAAAAPAPAAGPTEAAVAPDAAGSAPAPPAATPEPAPPAVVAEAAKPKPAPPKPQTLTITFDVNSSYFPASLNGRLRQLATGLEQGQPYAVELTGSVGTDPVTNGGAGEAAAYNRWIAERRMDRVAEFLQNTSDADLTIKRSFARNDSSRRVVVKIHPTLP